jgi:hypothetical protein
MIDIRAIAVATIVLLLLGGCGQSAKPPSSAPAAVASRPDVTITVDATRRKCVVRLSSEAQGSFVACDDVVAFVKDELRLRSGSIYDVRATPDVDAREIARVRANLNGAGYRFIGESHDER